VFTDRRTPAAGLATNSPADLRRPGTNSNLFGERKLNSIIFQKKGEFWGCSRAVTRSRAESEVASLGGFVRCLRNLQRPLLCPGWERPQNERRATGSDSEVAPLGWRKTRKGASATRGRRRMRRGSAAWCGLPQSPPGDRGTSGGEPSPSAIRFLPAGASTDGDGDLSPRLLLVWERTRFSWWLGAACLDGGTKISVEPDAGAGRA